MLKLALFVLALPGILQSPPVAGEADAKHAIQTIYDKSNDLLLKKDVGGLTKLLQATHSSDFVFTSRTSGKRSLRQLIASMKSVLGTYDVSHASARIVRITVKGTFAIVGVSTDIDLVTRTAPPKAAHSVEEQAYGQDSWTNVGGEWRLKASKVLSEIVIRDGKRDK